MENGDVYTFGYGQHGQLGHGDVNSRYLTVQGENKYSLLLSIKHYTSSMWDLGSEMEYNIEKNRILLPLKYVHLKSGCSVFWLRMYLYLQ